MKKTVSRCLLVLSVALLGSIVPGIARAECCDTTMQTVTETTTACPEAATTKVITIERPVVLKDSQKVVYVRRNLGYGCCRRVAMRNCCGQFIGYRTTCARRTALQKVLVERVIQKPVIIEKPVMIDRPIERPICIEKPLVIERQLEIEQPAIAPAPVMAPPLFIRGPRGVHHLLNFQLF